MNIGVIIVTYNRIEKLKIALDSFAKQRSRWSRGCVQVFKNYKIIGNKGLNFRQKLDYISSIIYNNNGYQYIIFSTDSDFIQLINNYTFLYITRGKKSILYTEK